MIVCVLVIKQYRIAKHHSENMELVSQKRENQKTHEGFVYRLGRILSNGAESLKCAEKKSHGRFHVMNSDIEITGNHDHVSNPAKIEMKQSLSEVRRRPSQSRDTPRPIIEEIQATLLEEEVAELAYSSLQ